MDIIVISPKASEDSAKRLAKELNAEYDNPYQSGRNDYTAYDVIINYGYSQLFKMNRHVILVNSPASVQNCIDKRTTLHILAVNGVPVPEFAAKVKDEWGVVFCHTKPDGRKNEGIVHWYRDNHEPIPPAYLYTNYYAHRGEYRVVVLDGVVVGRYRKVLDDEGMWSFELRDKRGFDFMDAACLKAARVLGAKYVGFDVLAKRKDDFVILEANSGPILTDESVEAFKDYLGV